MQNLNGYEDLEIGKNTGYCYTATHKIDRRLLTCLSRDKEIENENPKSTTAARGAAGAYVMYMAIPQRLWPPSWELRSFFVFQWEELQKKSTNKKLR